MKKSSKIFKFTLQKPDNFPFIILEEWAHKVAAQIIKFLLNLSKEILLYKYKPQNLGGENYGYLQRGCLTSATLKALKKNLAGHYS